MVALKPLVTEKSYVLSRKGLYVFRADKSMRKKDIAALLKDQYGVDAVRVRTLVMPSSKKRVGKKRLMVRERGWKKAYVTLAKGQELQLITPKES